MQAIRTPDYKGRGLFLLSQIW